MILPQYFTLLPQNHFKMLFLLMVLLNTTTKSLEKTLIINNTNFTLSTTLHHAATKAIRKAGNHIPDTVTGYIKYSTTNHPNLKSFLATETLTLVFY